MDVKKVSAVFVSATATDCGSWREHLKQAVERYNAGAKVHLQEDWTDAAVFVLDACRQRVDAQDAYFGLFGHRYGWVPPGHEPDSITRLEWTWAVERWRREREAPLFILLPAPDSEADRALDAAAEAVLKQEFKRQPVRRAESRARQRAFVDDVRRWAQSRFIRTYSSQQDLREIAATSVLNWNQALLERAGAGRRGGHATIPGDELGRIGRGPQLAPLAALADEWGADRSRPRWACIAVHGPQNHGQRAFGDLLLAWEGWDDLGEVECLDGHLDRPDDPDQLARWACNLLKRPVVDAPPLPALAQALAARLATGSVLLLLRSLGTAADRWAKVVTGFWQPLKALLASQRVAPAADAPAAGWGQLLLCLVDHADAPVQQAGWFGAAPPAESGFDPARVFALPALTPLKTDDVADWLKSLKDRDLVIEPARRKAIAQAAVQPDGRPTEVYERLQTMAFWA